MKVLLDNGLPPGLRHRIPGHEVVTSLRMGWLDLENGDLLKAAHEAAFAVIVTKDANIRHQQSKELLIQLGLGVVVLRPEKESRHAFYALADELIRTLPDASPGTFQEIGPRAGL